VGVVAARKMYFVKKNIKGLKKYEIYWGKITLS
jgi:hypothetical protein